MVSRQSVTRLVRFAVVCLGLGAGCTAADPEGEDVGVASAALLGVAACPAGYNIIQGTSAANTINGTAGNDCILGLGGNDTINGEGGNDFLIGGAGVDAIYGAAGNDTLYGEDGNDDLNGGIGNDTLYGGIGTDYLGGEPGDDRLFGEDGIDYLYGNEDNDILSGGASNDECYGGLGHDVLAGGAGTDVLRSEDGDDAIADTGSNTINGGNGSDRCTGTSCELAAPVASGCTQASQCAASQTCVADVGVCLPCGTVGGVGCNSGDNCPSDPNKTQPGICGCGIADTDSDGDGTANCNDACPSNAPKIAPGVCGCAVADTDSDSDGTANCNDTCPSDATKIAAGICGCGVADTDSDSDGTANCLDACPNNAPKIAPGVCGCAVADTDSDSDGTANCNDSCPNDAAKTAVGACGCGVPDTDTDSDGTANCNDACPSDPAKLASGVCGCGIADTDSDADGVANCNDVCAGFPDTQDTDEDGVPDGCDVACPFPDSVYNGSVYVDENADLTALFGYSCISGSLVIDGPGVDSLRGIHFLRFVGGDLIIRNTALRDLSWLEMGSVVGAVRIENNDRLAELSSFTHIGGHFGEPTAISIANNANLSACWVWWLVDRLGKSCVESEPGTALDCSGNTGSASCGELPYEVVCEPGATGPGIYDGDLVLSGPGSANELDELGGFSCVTGSVTIEASDLTNVDALYTVRHIGGSLTVRFNDQLNDLHGFAYLESISTNDPEAWLPLLIQHNEQLPGCWSEIIAERVGTECGAPGLGNTWCLFNDGEGTCTWEPVDGDCAPGSTGLDVFEGDYSPSAMLWYNPVCITGSVWLSQPSQYELSRLGLVQGIGGNLYIEWGSSLDDLSGLDNLRFVRGEVFIIETPVTSLDGLDNIRYIGGELTIWGNPNLEDLRGLRHLESVDSTGGNSPPVNGSLAIADNTALAACWVETIEAQVGLECAGQYYECDGNEGEASCSQLPPGFECESGATGPGVYDGDILISSSGGAIAILGITPLGYDFSFQSIVDLAGVECVTGDVYIEDGAVTDISPLTLAMIGGSFYIFDTLLVDLDGLGNLTSIGGQLWINGNAQLQSLEALANLESLATSNLDFDLLIAGNPLLHACWVSVLESQTRTSCGANFASCELNDGTVNNCEN